MPRKKLFPNDQFPIHVTARSFNREWFDLPIHQMWEIFSRYLYFCTLIYGIRIHSFVLMSNHLHLLITDPQEKMNAAMTYLLSEVSKAVKGESAETSEVFDGPCKSSVIRNRVYYEFAYKYVYRNPVEARISEKVEAYSYSSLRGLLGMDHLPFPAFDNSNLIANPNAQLRWLNSPFPTIEFLDEIRRGLKLPKFEMFEEVDGLKGSADRSPAPTIAAR